ncbi:MAG: PD40 domain-containing protein [Phycisphaerae bacterium]|nr:PD40 domain-containing protein [Phycisphaerae bacterium]
MNPRVRSFGLVLILISSAVAWAAEAEVQDDKTLLAELKSYPHKIVYESQRGETWQLVRSDADGSNPTSLTDRQVTQAFYPKVSPDGTKISFVADEGEGDSKVRSVYLMNIDGTGRELIGRNTRQPCWHPDGTKIAYLKGEFKEFNCTDFATKGLFFYDLKTKKHRQHPNEKIHHLYNICWSPDGKWIFTTVHAGMGFQHGILAIEADGMQVVNLGIPGCRPDISPDGKHVAWNATDWVIMMADIDMTGPQPKLKDSRSLVTSKKPSKVYHADFSPDGKYVAFSRGSAKKRLGMAPEIVGVAASGWDICVVDVSRRNRWVQITHEGQCNKEPDWQPIKGAQ